MDSLISTVLYVCIPKKPYIHSSSLFILLFFLYRSVAADFNYVEGKCTFILPIERNMLFYRGVRGGRGEGGVYFYFLYIISKYCWCLSKDWTTFLVLLMHASSCFRRPSHKWVGTGPHYPSHRAAKQLHKKIIHRLTVLNWDFINTVSLWILLTWIPSSR